MSIKRKFVYDIPPIKRVDDGIERGTPSAHIEIEFPHVVNRASEFRDLLELSFTEILEVCDSLIYKGL